MTQKADVLWKSLKGIMCVYKPAEASLKYVKHKILSNLCYELNQLETRPPCNYLDIVQTETEISVNVRPSFADNVLCVGPRYQPQDFEFQFCSPMGTLSSGVVVLGINDGIKLAKVLKHRFLPKCYHVKGIFGQVTHNFHIHGKVLAKAKFNHVSKNHLDRVLTSYQAVNQRKIFHENGFDLQSQKAYDLAISGLHRSNDKQVPILYNFKCIHFDPPEFTLEINCVNETEVLLMNLIHNIGLSLKCFATCTGLQCVKQGFFTIEHALLKKHWKLSHISENMKLCFEVLENYLPQMRDQLPVLTTVSA